MPPPETYESEIGSQPAMCQVHTGAYVSLLAPEKENRLCRWPPRKDHHVYITRSTYHYATRAAIEGAPLFFLGSRIWGASTPLQLKTFFWGQIHLNLVSGGLLGSKGVKTAPKN